MTAPQDMAACLIDIFYVKRLQARWRACLPDGLRDVSLGGSMKSTNGQVLAARLSEPFIACTTASEAIDAPGYSLARRLWEENPKKYGLVARDLFDLYQPATVARNHRVSVETVRSIRNLYPELVHAGKLRLMANLEEASVLLSNRLIDEIKDLDISKVPAALGQIVEKLSLLSGGATIRTEHVEAKRKVATPEELQALFARLPASELNNTI